MESYGLYIHIPFCLRKCPYCDFVSYDDRRETQAAYVAALKREISSCKAREIDTVFIGGGTPSCLRAEWIGEILAVCGETFEVQEAAEITIEANPAALDREKLQVYRRAGINRVSMGVQSMDDGELERLGRLHTAAAVRRNFEMLRGAGFDNVNLDVMFGIPGQTLQSFRRTLEQICALAPEHVSVYSLIVEPGTRFSELAEEGRLSLPDEDTERAMYELAIDLLQSRGYAQYEISNFARPGFESRHNLKYWTCRPYLGVGLAAHSYDGVCRFYNTGDLDTYLDRQTSGVAPTEERLPLSVRDRMTEFIIMGLRLCKGISLAEFEMRFGCDFLSKFGESVKRFCDLELARLTGGRFALTRAGFSVSNSILCEFVSPR